MPAPKDLGVRLLAAAVTVLVAAVVIAALVIAGPPWKARQVKADRERVQDLESIVTAIRGYHAQHERLPASLDKLKDQPGLWPRSIRDLRTGTPYEYRPLSPRRYELCATFETDTTRERRGARPDVPDGEPFWRHPVGRKCFQIDVKR